MDIVVNVGATRPRPPVLTARDLSTVGWTLDPLRPEATTLVVGGRHISVDATGRITVQDAAVPLVFDETMLSDVNAILRRDGRLGRPIDIAMRT
jgi:hypothetical protein